MEKVSHSSLLESLVDEVISLHKRIPIQEGVVSAEVLESLLFTFHVFYPCAIGNGPAPYRIDCRHRMIGTTEIFSVCPTDRLNEPA